MCTSPATTPPASPTSDLPHDRNTGKCHTLQKDAPQLDRLARGYRADFAYWPFWVIVSARPAVCLCIGAVRANVRICRQQGLPVLPCRACRTGTVAPGGGADRESRRRSSGSPGRDARMPPRLEERAPGCPAVGRVPAAPGRSGPGDGRQRGIIQQARVPTDGRTPRNVAVEPAGAVPGRRGTGGWLPGASRPVRHYAQRRERPGRTRALPPLYAATGRGILLAVAAHSCSI